MQYQLNFSVRQSLTPNETGLLIPITLSTPTRQLQTEAYFDSGARYSVLPRWLGEDLGFIVEDGKPVGLRTGGGVMQTYLHYVTLTVAELVFDDVPLCVAKHTDFNRCLLGRGGWLQKTRFGLVTYDNQFFLGLYDE